MSSGTHTRKLGELNDRQLKAKQANREAEAAALAARNAVEQAEQQVIRAHAGHGELRAAERALTKAEAEVKDTGLRAKGAALRLEEAQTQVRQYRGTHYRQLIEETEADARQAVEKLRNGAESIREGHAMWAQQAQVVNDLLLAGGLRAGDNMPHEHQLTEIARMLRSFDGEIVPPLPHYRALHFKEEEEQRTVARMREERTAA
jgi:hypothetical protein